MRPRLALPVLILAGLVAMPAQGQAPPVSVPGTVNPTVPAARDTDPVVLTGKDLLAGGNTWAAPENLNAAIPGRDLQCYVEEQGASCPEEYNKYQAPDVETGGPVEGTPTDRLLGFRWNGRAFEQIPFQVDEVFTRYLNNNRSGFGIYSGTEKHTTYAFDREGFRFTQNSGEDGCVAAMKPGDRPAVDPVKGLDTNDELAFMAADAGDRAPAGAKLPAGVDGVKLVTLTDPTNPAAAPRFVYVMRAAEKDGARPKFDAKNGYVDYERDTNADTLVFSQSTYKDYGPGIEGPYCTADGQPVLNPDGTRKIANRKPLDTATISTDRYRYRYDGRWLMTEIRIAEGPGRSYGPDLVDRFKARAFAQDPGSQTPCCGYEEEDTNWGGSSSLLGERVGPVRAIRETWGADSGTNVVRRETFYRERMVQKTWLRVHAIPPLDGIYAQWDFNAGNVTRFFNANNPRGVPIDGVNDELYGNFDDPCNTRWDGRERTDIDEAYRSIYQASPLCASPYSQSVDPGDATFAEANAALGWSQISGPAGTIVDRIHAQATDQTPGGAVQGLAAVPYYRDDACFDDGTGSDPGPVLNLRSATEKMDYEGAPRRCWKGEKDGLGTPRYFQGSIGTHGLHLLFLADSDNARTTAPVTEIVSDWDLVMLPPSQTVDAKGQPVNVGEQYGRPLEKPLVATVMEVPPA